MAIHNELLPHLNKSSHGYAYEIRSRVRQGLITEYDAKQEINNRPDREVVIGILRKLKTN